MCIPTRTSIAALGCWLARSWAEMQVSRPSANISNDALPCCSGLRLLPA